MELELAGKRAIVTAGPEQEDYWLRFATLLIWMDWQR